MNNNAVNKNKVRVLVVDDSALMRKLIPRMIEADKSIEVVGTAMDCMFCLKKIEELQPNVVTLDLEMPGMNGIDTLKEIMRRNPMPVRWRGFWGLRLHCRRQSWCRP